MKIKGMDYMFYNVTDLKKSLKFYRDILGLKVTQEKESWAELDLGNMTLAIGVFGASKNAKIKKNAAAAALAVDDIGEVTKFLKSKKVKIIMPAMAFDPCWMAMIEDPDRNQIILHQRKDGTVG